MRALPDGIEVRPVTGADRARLSSILDEGIGRYRSFAPEGWRPPQLTDEQRLILAERFDGLIAWGLLAFDGDEAVGLVSISKIVRADKHPAPPGSGFLWQMFVRPSWQGRGLAGPLLDRALEEARERGYERLVLWAAAGAEQARRFYEKEGFELTGREQLNEEIGLPLVQYSRVVPPR